MFQTQELVFIPLKITQKEARAPPPLHHEVAPALHSASAYHIKTCFSYLRIKLALKEKVWGRVMEWTFNVCLTPKPGTEHNFLTDDQG